MEVALPYVLNKHLLACVVAQDCHPSSLEVVAGGLGYVVRLCPKRLCYYLVIVAYFYIKISIFI